MKENVDHRNFPMPAGKVTLAAGAVSAGFASSASAEDKKDAMKGHMHHGAGNGVTVEVSKTRCSSCAYWGGMRQASKDGKSVTSLSHGVCNNPKSPNYGKYTAPDHGPMSVWKKWDAVS